jgi:putative ABC transport system ATP-binding protein
MTAAGQSNDQPVIELIDLHKTYRVGTELVHALQDVSLCIRQNEYVAVMGPSGSGKSTLMNIIGCLDRPTDGSYVLEGVDVSHMSKVQLAAIRNQHIGFVFQSFNLLARTSAVRNVMLPLVYSRNVNGGALSQDERRERAMAALEAVGLADRAAARGHRPGPDQRSLVDPGRRADRQPGHRDRRRDHGPAA